MLGAKKNAFLAAGIFCGIFLPSYTAPLVLMDLKISWDGSQAINDIKTQVDFGPRSAGMAGHQKEIDFIRQSLAKTSAKIIEQKGVFRAQDGKDYDVQNIIARFDMNNPRRVLLGTHYDSIIKAYADKQSPNGYMPGANNSASGVALLLQTARQISAMPTQPKIGVDIVFFDREEGPSSLGAGENDFYPIGSPFFAQNLADFYANPPSQAIIFDMVCDKNLLLRPDVSSLESAPQQANMFWDIGRLVSEKSFSKSPLSYSITDDQTALSKERIPSFIVIDFDYAPWFNTTQDTPDKCSAESLENIGNALLQYIYMLN